MIEVAVINQEMNFSKAYLLLLLIGLQKGSQSQQNLKLNEGQARQGSFIEWLASLLQFPPINGNIVPPTTPTFPPFTTESPTEPKNCQPCSCGTPNVIKRIVGGEETQEIRFPWMTLLKYNNRFYCGGSLISDQHVLTAGHCLRGFSSFAISVSLLVHDRNANSSREINRKAKRVYIHERYSPYNIDNDIGIIHLAEPVEMSNILRPVCMPPANETFEGKTGIATGWGALSEGGPISQKLMVSLNCCRNLKTFLKKKNLSFSKSVCPSSLTSSVRKIMVLIV